MIIKNNLDAIIFFAPFLIVGYLAILMLFKREKIRNFLKHGDVAKKLLLKKVTAISVFVLLAFGCLIFQRMPLAKELGLIECSGFAFFYSCGYNQKGWILFLATIVLLVMGLILFIKSLKKEQKF